MNYKKLTGLSLIAATALTLAACQNNQYNGDTSVVKGDDINITESDLYNAMKGASGASYLRQLTLTAVFRKEVGEDTYKEIESSATEKIAQMKKSMGDNFEKTLTQMGIPSEDSYKQQLIFYDLYTKAVEKNISVSDDELNEAYKNYHAPIEVSHILVADEDTAKQVIEKLKNGEDFAALAKEYSTDTSTKDNGGSLGTLSQSDMDKMDSSFRDAAYKLGAGEYTTEPVHTDYGYHIIKVTKIDEKGSLDDLKDELTESVKQEKMSDQDTVLKIVHDLLEKYNIKIEDSDLATALDQYDPEKVAESQSEASNSSATSESSSSSDATSSSSDVSSSAESSTSSAS